MGGQGAIALELLDSWTSKGSSSSVPASASVVLQPARPTLLDANAAIAAGGLAALTLDLLEALGGELVISDQ